MEKTNVLRLAVAGAVFVGLVSALMVLAALVKMPGAEMVGSFINKIGSAYGLSVSWTGLVIALLWGLLKGFVVFGVFGLIYNGLSNVGKK